MGKARVTMEDVAKAAGVGVATVDRVLNGRARVRTSTAEQVLHAAEQLGPCRSLPTADAGNNTR